MGPRRKKKARRGIAGSSQAPHPLSATYEELFDAAHHAMDCVVDLEHAELLPRQIASATVHGKVDNGLEDDYEGGSIALERLKGSLKRSLEERMHGADAEALREAAGRTAQLMARIMAPNEDTDPSRVSVSESESGQAVFARALSRGVDEKIIRAAKDRFDRVLLSREDQE
jgi:hypothetical protein